MEEIKYYTTIGTIQDMLNQSWHRHGKKIDFSDAVIELYRRGLLTHEWGSHADYGSWDCCDPRDLMLIHRSEYLDVTDIVDSPSLYTTILPETLSFFDKDVWALLLLNNEAVHMHDSDCFEITYVMSGSAILRMESGDRTLAESSFCIISPDVTHEVSAIDESVVLDIIIKRSTFETAFASILGTDNVIADFLKNYLYGALQNYIQFIVPLTPSIAMLTRAILSESNSKRDYSREVCNHYMGILLAEALREGTQEYTHNSTKRSISVQMPLILAYIRNNYQDLNLRKLADFFGYDTDYVGKLILKSTGMHFNDILNTVRIDRAVDLLLYTDMTLSEISDMSGFNSVDHFSRTFRRLRGISPGKFRRNSSPDEKQHELP